MAATPIDATVGTSTANSYVTQAEALQYAADRYPSPTTWLALTSDQQIATLLLATKRLQQEEFYGVPIKPWGPDLASQGTVQGQALSWPRWGWFDINGYPGVRQDIIPSFIKQAQMELAFALGTDDIVSNVGLEPFDNVQIGSLNVKPTKGYKAFPLPDSVRRIIAHVLKTGGSGVTLSRG